MFLPFKSKVFHKKKMKTNFKGKDVRLVILLMFIKKSSLPKVVENELNKKKKNGI